MSANLILGDGQTESDGGKREAREK